MKVTKGLIESHILEVDYIDGQSKAGATMTICIMRMINDFEIVGTSACCLNPDEFNREAGRKLAYEDAIRKAFELEVYHMAAEKLNQAVLDDAQLDMAKRTGLKFGEAIEHLKAGGVVCRKDWHLKGMWLSLSGHDVSSRFVDAAHFWSDNNAAFAQSKGGAAKVDPCFTLKTSQDTIQMGWTPSQPDMLAEDWEVVL